MKVYKLLLVCTLAAVSVLSAGKNIISESSTIRANLLVVLGGKKIDTTSFMAIFDSFSDVAYDTINKKRLFDEVNTVNFEKYSAFVFYDSYSATTPEEDNMLIHMAEQETGMLFLHHAITSHQGSKEFQKIVGGRYHHNPWYDGVKKYGPSTYKHDQDYTVLVTDSKHPVTKDIKDFEIHDETYINMEVNSNVRPLMESSARESVKYIGWINYYENTPVIYLQPGHDAHAYNNANFRKLIYNAVIWLSNGQ